MKRELTLQIDRILDAYIECALWSSTDESTESGGYPLDANYGPEDLTRKCRAEMRRDIRSFLEYCQETGIDLSSIRDSMIGYDFWLTRNGHGAGFWDRGLGDLGDQLTKAAKTFGAADLYVSRKRIHHA